MQVKQELSGDALKVRRAYYRRWRQENPDKVREYRDRYWEKKAQKSKEKDSDEERC